MTPQNQRDLILDLTQLTHVVEYYYFLVVCSLGFAANMLNILVCQRKELLKYTMGFYNILMSVFNILTLVAVGYLEMFSQSTSSTPLILRSGLNCVLITYFIRVFAHMSTWLNVMVTADRLLCVYNTNKFKFLKNKTLVSGLVVAVNVVICCANVPSLFFRLDPKTNVCSSTKLVVLLRDSIVVIVRFLAPLVLQLAMNTMLVRKLFKAKQNRSMSTRMRREYRFAFTTVVLNVVFIVTGMPMLVSMVFINIYGYDQTYISKRSSESALASFVYLCSVVFVSFFYVALFFVNFFTNKMFRRECKNIYFGK